MDVSSTDKWSLPGHTFTPCVFKCTYKIIPNISFVWNSAIAVWRAFPIRLVKKVFLKQTHSFHWTIVKIPVSVILVLHLLEFSQLFSAMQSSLPFKTMCFMYFERKKKDFEHWLTNYKCKFIMMTTYSDTVYLPYVET